MRALAVVLSVGLLVGCADAGEGLPGTVADSQDSATDVAVADNAQPDTAQDDASELDATLPDTGGPSTCDPGDGCFGESCTSADDCLSGICTMHLGDKVCSKTCDEACPQGFSCTLVGSGGDGQYVCLSKFSHLCLPCEGSDGCTADTPNACVKYADGTSFCGGSCDLETPCPSGYACQEVETSDGANSYQCVNTAGVCPCSNLAIDSALATPCEATNEQGTCEGVRICEETGLSDCSATEPAAELCNGIDDDCNGLTDENTCDDGNDCTVDTCEGEGGCQHDPLNAGECLDGDACTIGDHCEAGVCVGQAIDCDDGNPCTESTCDGLGGCQHENIVAVCDDGDACTLGDICQEGECTGSASLTCDDGNPCTDDSCGEAGCVFEANEAGCDDGNACTSGDICQGGACKGAQVACDDDNLCTTDSCDIEAGCINTHNTQPCDDGDVCSLGDACLEGACASGENAATCDDGNPCTDDNCDAGLGCVFSPNDSPCDDKNSCTTSDGCVEGACIGSGSLACDDDNPCTVDSCLPNGGCTYEHAVGACDDGDACTVNDACVDGGCASGVKLSCEDGNVCTDEACEGGDCVFTPNAADCDDGNACTSASTCQDGGCVASEILDCDDKNACTSDACDAKSGCVHINNALQCTDADPCTIGDGCVDGSCQSGEGDLPCDDGNPCTDDSCQKGVGCTFTPNSAACDDGNACTIASACKDGACQAEQMLSCTDGNPCTDDSCDVVVGCVYTANKAPCDDGDACTVGDACIDGDCEVGDGVLVCDDGLFCNGQETCVAKSGCVLGEPPVIDDGVGCTMDSCDEELDQVVSTPDDEGCVLEGDDLCKVGVCDPSEGCVEESVPNCCGNGEVEPDEACDDGNALDGDGCDSCNCVATDWEWANLVVAGGATHTTQGNNDMDVNLKLLTDNETGPVSGTEAGNKAYNVCFFYDWGGSRTLTIDIEPGSNVSRVRYFSSNNGGGGVAPPKNFKITLLPSGQVVVAGQNLSAGWNTFDFPPEKGVEQVQLQLTKQGEHSCVSEIEIGYDACCGNGIVNEGEDCDGGPECDANCAFKLPKTCKDVQGQNPAAGSGAYEVDPDGPGGSAPFNVYCDMSTEGGGWTVLMKGDQLSETFPSSAVNAPSPGDHKLSDEQINLLLAAAEDTYNVRLKCGGELAYADIKEGWASNGGIFTCNGSKYGACEPHECGDDYYCGLYIQTQNGKHITTMKNANKPEYGFGDSPCRVHGGWGDPIYYMSR